MGQALSTGENQASRLFFSKSSALASRHGGTSCYAKGA